MTLRKTALIVMLILMLSACREDDMSYDMAEFDRAYVPALALTSKKETGGQAIMAIKTLKLEWQTFSGRYGGLIEEYKPLAEVGDLIDKADGQINANDFAAAHMALEGIREIMFEFRGKYGFDYFLDYLTVFHKDMEALIHAASGDIAVVRAARDKAFRSFNVMKAARFSRGVFGFSEESEAAMRSRINDIGNAFDGLDAALETGDREFIATRARGIKAAYQELFKMFGNFEKASL